MENCFCHLNGMAVKDATARKNIETMTKQEYTATPENLAEVIASANPNSVVILSPGVYSLLSLVGKNAFPEDLTILGTECATLGGVSVTSGVKDGDINSAYYNLPDKESCNTDVTNATLSRGLTFKNVAFTDSFSLRNARCDDLSFIGCTFAPGTYLYIDPNRMMDVYGGDFTAENHNFETRPFFAMLKPENLIIRECVFENAAPLEGVNTHIESNCSAIQVKGICGITVYKNTIKGAKYNGINIGGNDIVLYNSFSSGNISVTNNTILKSADRGIRFYTIKNAKVLVIRNQLANTNGNNLQSGVIKASGCENTEFHWDATGNNSNGSSNYIPEVDALGNVIYEPTGVAKIMVRLTTEKNGGIVVDGCTTPATDHIVEQGVIDIWTYRKWASGIAECWGRRNLNYNNNDNEIGLPFPFIDEPIVNVQTHELGTTCFIGHNGGYATMININDNGNVENVNGYNAYIAQVQGYFFNNNDCTITPIDGSCKFNIHCVGKWK